MQPNKAPVAPKLNKQHTTQRTNKQLLKHTNYDVIILGAGAAGLMAAATAGQRKRKVLLLDHSLELAQKIRISGGGRCNFTNLNIRPECYISENKHFCRSALAQYTQHDFIALVNKHRIKWHEKKQGQLFCDESSHQIIDMLNHECQAGHVTRLMQAHIHQISHTHPTNTNTQQTGFDIKTSHGNFHSQALIIATGGLAVPKIGATPLGYQLAQQFGLNIIAPTPALVPLTLHQEDLQRFAPLAGISLEAQVSVGKTTFKEAILFTHKGISGPAILQISSYWKPGQSITINLLPQDKLQNIFTSHTSANKKLVNILTEHGWPRRFTEAWLTTQAMQDKHLCELSAKKRQELTQAIQNWHITPNSTQGYKVAEVTRGGVDTKELDSKTMMAKKIPNLFFAGEVIDVTGWLGGYNFQWAWSSGYVAGMNV